MWVLILSVLINDVYMGSTDRAQPIALNHTAIIAGGSDNCRKAAENFHAQVKSNYPKQTVTLSYTCAQTR